MPVPESETWHIWQTAAKLSINEDYVAGFAKVNTCRVEIGNVKQRMEELKKKHKGIDHDTLQNCRPLESEIEAFKENTALMGRLLQYLRWDLDPFDLMLNFCYWSLETRCEKISHYYLLDNSIRSMGDSYHNNIKSTRDLNEEVKNREARILHANIMKYINKSPLRQLERHVGESQDEEDSIRLICGHLSKHANVFYKYGFEDEPVSLKDFVRKNVVHRITYILIEKAP